MPEADRIRLVLQDAEGEPRLSADLVASMLATLRGAAAPGVVTLEGSPGVFCQGMSLELMAPMLDEAPDAAIAAALDAYAQVVDAVGRCPRPVIALVDGPALGGGCGVAAAADVVLATRRAVFGLPEALIGLIPVYAFMSVAARTGRARARLLAMGGPTLTADEALRIGLVDEIVDDLDAACNRYATRLSRMDPRAIATIKRLVADADPCGAGYTAPARIEVVKLGASAETRARLGRMIAGEPPWLAGPVEPA
jgi:enoyl-CoA hydratase/carnithine racemase